MPFSSGTYSVVYSFTTEAASPPIEIAKLDEQFTDVATALSNCVLRDGTGLPTAATDWNGQRITNLGAATAANDAVRAAQLQSGALLTLGSVSGTNTITGSLTPALAAYTAGMVVVFNPAGNNTGATTLNINSLGALDILKEDGDALASGDLVAGVPAVLVLDSGADDWILLNPQTYAAIVATSLTVNGIAHTDWARLSQSNTFTGSSQVISSSGPTLEFEETDAAADNQRWFLYASNERLIGSAATDAGSENPWLHVDRTGNTVDSVNLQATAVQVNGTSINSASILTSGTLADGRVAESNVTQHEAALTIGGDQIETTVSTSSGSFTVGATHIERVISQTATGTITVNDSSASAVTTGDSIAVIRTTSDAVTFATGGSQTINSPGSRLTIPEQYGTAVLTYLGSNTWSLSGV